LFLPERILLIFMKEKKSGAGIRYARQAEALAAPIAEPFGIYIYDVEYVREGQEYFLNVYIDKEGGVTIGDCETVSRALSDALDEAGFLSDPYTLVVSSPGLGRTLTKDRHLRHSIGQDVEIHLYRPDPKTGEKDITGELVSFDSERIVVLAEPPVPSRGGTGGKKKAKKKKMDGAADESRLTDEGTDPAGQAEPSARDGEDKRLRLELERSSIASIRLAFYF
jgi:ribosome maturation factor RimP